MGYLRFVFHLLVFPGAFFCLWAGCLTGIVSGGYRRMSGGKKERLLIPSGFSDFFRRLNELFPTGGWPIQLQFFLLSIFVSFLSLSACVSTGYFGGDLVLLLSSMFCIFAVLFLLGSGFSTARPVVFRRWAATAVSSVVLPLSALARFVHSAAGEVGLSEVATFQRVNGPLIALSMGKGTLEASRVLLLFSLFLGCLLFTKVVESLACRLDANHDERPENPDDGKVEQEVLWPYLIPPIVVFVWMYAVTSTFVVLSSLPALDYVCRTSIAVAAGGVILALEQLLRKSRQGTLALGFFVCGSASFASLVLSSL